MELGQLEEMLLLETLCCLSCGSSTRMLGLASCTPGQLVFLAAEMELPQPRADTVLALCHSNICGSDSSSSNHG